jgi:hypothetical protein
MYLGLLVQGSIEEAGCLFFERLQSVHPMGSHRHFVLSTQRKSEYSKLSHFFGASAGFFFSLSKGKRVCMEFLQCMDLGKPMCTSKQSLYLGFQVLLSLLFPNLTGVLFERQ